MHLNESTLQYISEHAADDVAHLALHPSKDPQIDMGMALQQIAGMQKAKEKLPGWFCKKGIMYPKKVSLEQCSSSQTAEYKASLVSGDSFADFSGGFGVDTSAFGQKFKKGYYVEPQEELCRIFEHNCKILEINNVEIFNGTMESHIGQIGQVDMIYLDPSRRDSHGRRVVSLADCTPNLLEWKSALLEKCSTLMIKTSPMTEIGQCLRDLPETYAVHIVAVEGECKEVVFLLKRRVPTAEAPCEDEPRRVPTTDPMVIAVDICKNEASEGIREDSSHRFQTTMETERSTPPSIATELGAYLYEPNAALMKAGVFNVLSQQFQVAKIAEKTNLFTSTELRNNFPGRIFRIEAIHEFHRRKTAKELSHLASASIAVRNFPLTAEELRKTLKIKDGNDSYLFGCTLYDDRKVILQTHKVRAEL